VTVRLGLLDTSVLMAFETGRALDETALPEQVAVSVIRIAELHEGIHAARDRHPGSTDGHARIRHGSRTAPRRSSIAVARGIPVVTRDDDFAALVGLGGPDVVEV
jgi:predicted nucleic acid-binding protein